MTLEKFTELVNKLHKISDRSLALYQNSLDIINYDNDFYCVIDVLLEQIFSKEQKDWFEWFCYENDFGTKKLEAKDKDGNLICQDIEGLYKWIYG